MAWDTDYIFEGLQMFGSPLNVWKWEVYQSPYGPESLSYFRLHMNIDDNEDQFQRLLLNEKLLNCRKGEAAPRPPATKGLKQKQRLRTCLGKRSAFAINVSQGRTIFTARVQPKEIILF